MEIKVNLGLDGNRNGRIEDKEKVARLESLRDRDTNNDSKLSGSELTDLYFEHGKDVWLPAGASNPVTVNDDRWGRTWVTLKSITFAPPAVDLSITFRP